MNKSGQTNAGFKQTFGMDEQQNPVSHAYITKLD